MLSPPPFFFLSLFLFIFFSFFGYIDPPALHIGWRL